MIRWKFVRWINILLFPGVILHEVAHYMMVLVFASTTVEDFNLSIHGDSYVQYSIINPKIYKIFLISFAPFYINTSISVISIILMLQINILSIYGSVSFLVLYYISIVSATKSLPSTVDARAPINEVKRQFFTKRLPIIILLGPIYIVGSLPAYIISSIQMRSVNLYYVLGILYALVVLLITSLFALNILEISEFIDKIPYHNLKTDKISIWLEEIYKGIKNI